MTEMFEHLFRKRPEDETIPVLTEIIEPTRPAEGLTDEAPMAEPIVDAIEPAKDADHSTDAVVAATPALFDRAAIEVELRDAILTRLHSRLDPILEQRIDDAVLATLDAELPKLLHALREAVSETIDSSVSQAIALELDRRHPKAASADEY